MGFAAPAPCPKRLKRFCVTALDPPEQPPTAPAERSRQLGQSLICLGPPVPPQPRNSSRGVLRSSSRGIWWLLDCPARGQRWDTAGPQSPARPVPAAVASPPPHPSVPGAASPAALALHRWIWLPAGAVYFPAKPQNSQVLPPHPCGPSLSHGRLQVNFPCRTTQLREAGEQQTALPAPIPPLAFALGCPGDRMKLPRAVPGDGSVMNAITLPALSRGTAAGKGALQPRLPSQLFRLFFGKQRPKLCLWNADSGLDLATGYEKQNIFCFWADLKANFPGLFSRELCLAMGKGNGENIGSFGTDGTGSVGIIMAEVLGGETER